MDIDVRQFNKKIKQVKEIATYSNSSISTIDETIEEAKKIIKQLEFLREIQVQKIGEKKLLDEVWDSMVKNAKQTEKKQSLRLI